MSKEIRVSNSRIKCWRKCHNKHFYRYVMKIEKKRKDIKLTVGKLFHDCTEAVAKSKTVNPTIKRYRKHLATLMEEERVLYEDGIDLAEGMINNYLNKYKDDDFELLGVEIPLEYEITKGITFIGYIDKLINNGHLSLMEHKTCKSIPDESVRLTDIQTLLYIDAMEKCGMDKPREVIWDYSRKKLPVIPEMLKSGKGLSQRKDIDTLYKVYLKAITDNKLKISDYKEILANLKSKPDTFFRRIRYPISKHQVNLVVDDFIRTSIEIKHMGEFERTRNFDFQCGSSCEYHQLCVAETFNVDTDFILKKQYRSRSSDKKTQEKEPF